MKFKSEQTAVAGSFDPETALMVAKESAEGKLEFKNVVGYVKLTTTFDCKKITLVNKGTYPLAGGTQELKISDEGIPSVYSTTGGVTSVSISGDIKANTTYYIAVLPEELTDGFKLIFTDSDGNDSYRESSKTLEIKRSTVTDLGSIEKTNLSDIPYVTFSAEESQGFKMKLAKLSQIETGTFEYSVGGAEWKQLESNKEIEFGGSTGDLRLRGISSIGTAGTSNRDDERSVISFTQTKVKVAASGDIRTLVNWQKYNTAYTRDARFQKLFYECTVLTSAPELPITSLASGCYKNMFCGCTSLQKAPELPAGTLAKQCYKEMFYGCSKIDDVIVKAIRQSDTYDNYFENWLKDAALSGTIHKRSSLELSTNSDYGIPSGWKAVDDVTD